MYDTESAPAEDPAALADRQLGARLRGLRNARNLSLKVVSARAGVSIGAISQVERGVSSPSIKALRAICTAIGVPMNSLFRTDEEQGDEDGIIVRKHARRRLNFNDKGMIKELLTVDEGDGLQLMEAILEPGCGSGDTSYSHAGKEAGMVTRGEVSFWVDERRYDLWEGDSFCFDSTRPHRFRNTGSDEARIVWAVTHAFY